MQDRGLELGLYDLRMTTKSRDPENGVVAAHRSEFDADDPSDAGHFVVV